MTAMTSAVSKHQVTPEYDPYSAAMVNDPYPTYASLRAYHPVYYNDSLDFYALTRYSDIVEYGRDWQTFSYAQGADIDNSGEAFGPGNFLEEDPPAHTLMRDVVRKLFVPKALRARLETVIEREAVGLIEVLVERGEADFATDVAWVLPMRVAAELLDLPREDLPLLASWEAEFSRRTLGSRTIPTSTVEASRRLRSYFAELIEARALSPRDDLLSVIAAARLDGARLGEIGSSMALLLWAASIETTASLLTNGTVLLDEHPEQRDWLAERPDAIPNAVEEMLRFESPLQVMKRTTTRAVKLHGEMIPVGASVFTVYGAANRDERRLSEAETFDVRREPQRHLAFGDGIHHCLGAPLARLEAGILFRVLLDRSRRYAVRREGLVRLENYITRGFTRVPLVTA